MTTIQAETTWQEVTQIEPDDYVIAGPNQGINIQLGQLAGRDEFLKNLIEVTKQQIFSELAKQGQLNKILCPPGIVTHYGGKNPPEGWLVCDGSKLKKEQYPELYAAIGDIYGADEISFNLPEARYEFIRGAGPNLVVGTKKEAALMNHFHYLPTQNGSEYVAENGISAVILDNIGLNNSVSGSFAGIDALSIKGNNLYLDSVGGMPRTYSTSVGTNFNTEENNNYPNHLVLLAIIKY
ncbi:hypothetical protein A6A19_00880 [Actinobacillus delphinicola]|uniref:phage tail protein n=1 Tax=Actinobacillus delphinicola TaxID=51161 RepID=UPI00244274B9|nr:phage tail protein [Actinobacillus delphinicola]MDG6896583.1 hypothetical protein [Actinobacillus delphinicola]